MRESVGRKEGMCGSEGRKEKNYMVGMGGNKKGKIEG